MAFSILIGYIGGSKGGAPPRSNVLHFHAFFWEIIGCCSSLELLPPLENPGSALSLYIAWMFGVF